MTDLLPATSSLTQGSLLPEAETLDASAIDRNLRAIRQVEATWRLPELPDGVRLDLAAAPGASHTSVSRFLHGLQADMDGKDEDEGPTFSDPLPALRVRGFGGQPLSPLAVDGYDKAFSYVNQLRGLKPSEVLDGDATQRWKLRAIERGYLEAPSDGVVDSTWSPELTSIQRRMQYDDYDQSLRGNRFGALPMTDPDGEHGVLDILNKWTSPSGLMRAAVDLDLFWDFGQISKEFDSWGDKWRKLGDSKNPWDFAGNLIDAVTGPIDDIVLPALNMALLFTGVGAATNYARLAITGVRAAEAAEVVNFATSIYRVPRLGRVLEGTVGRVFPAALDAERLAESSMLANRLVKSASPGLKSLGGAMQKWREIPAVYGTRGIVQTGMKLGVISQAEDLLPSYEGVSAGDVPAVADAADRALRNAWVTGPAEILFTPYTMFEPGTFTKGGLQVVKSTFKNLGTVRGRMVLGGAAGAGYAAWNDETEGWDIATDVAAGAAIGAAMPAMGKVLEGAANTFTFRGKQIPLLGATGRAVQLLDFEPLANDQRMTGVFMEAMRRRLNEEDWADFEGKIAEHGFLKAFAKHAGVGDDEKSAAAVMTFVTLSAAIDRTAAMQAGANKGTAGWFYRYYLARNKLVNQVRYFDPNDVNNAEVAWSIVSKESKTLRGARKRYDEYVAAIEADPTSFAEALAHHNDQAVLTMRQLLSPDNLPIDGLDFGRMADDFVGTGSVFNPEAQYQATLSNLNPLMQAGRTNGEAEGLVDYIATTLDSFGRWGEYQPLMSGLNDVVHAGLFSDARLAAATSYMGTNAKLNLVESLPEWDDDMADGLSAVINQHINDTIFLDKTMTIEQARRAGFHVNPLAAEINPMRSKVTLQRVESVTKQELLQMADELKRVRETVESLSKAATRVRTEVDAAGATVQRAIVQDPGFVDLSTTQLRQVLTDAGYSSEQGSEVRRLHRMLNYLKAKGYDVSGSPGLVLQKYMQDLDVDPRWQEIGMRARMLSKDGKPLEGAAALRARENEIRNLSARTAAAIDKDHLLEQIALRHGAVEVDSSVSTILPEDATTWSKDLVVRMREDAAAELYRSGNLESLDEARAKVGKWSKQRLRNWLAKNSTETGDWNDYWQRVDKETDLIGGARTVTPNYDSDEYLRVQAMFDQAERAGYRVVYGQEFLMPNDLGHVSGIFNDINERHMNAMTLGNFFGRRYPQELAANVQLARQRAIAKRLAQVWGKDVDPADPRVVEATDDLYRLIIEPERSLNQAMLSDISHQNLIDKLGTSIRTSGQPRSLQDLGLGRNRQRVMDVLQKVGWSEDEAHAVWRGLREGRYAEWKDQGLYAIEAKLRRNNQFVQALHLLGGTNTAKGWQMGAAMTLGGAAGGRYVAAATTEEGEDPNPLAVIAGIAGGAALGAGASKGIRMAGEAFDASEWARYGYMADWLASTRDRLRFSLSPFFDASRYTEAWVLGQIAAPTRDAQGARMVMPLNQSPKTLRKRFLKEFGGDVSQADAKMARIEAEFQAASKGMFDPNMIEQTQRQFEEVGMLGFNPTRWMMSSFHYMRENGMSADQAYEAVREMYTYGTRSRSAFEQSVNFVFFPFSFAKKTFKHAAGWVADDLLRSVLIHDSLKLYEELDQRYNLGDAFEEHLPLLSRLKQLNTFAFGMSPGRLGGVNAPFIDFAIGDPFSDDPESRGAILNFFGPQGLNVGAGISQEDLMKLARRSLPVMNDVAYLAQDLKEQGHVITDPAHVTRREQATRGYAEWAEYTKGVREALAQSGASWYDLYNNPGLVELKAEYLRKKTELERLYPGWVESKLEGRGDRARLEQEREMRLNTYLYSPEEATQADEAFAMFEFMLEGDPRTGAPGMKQVLESYGITDWDQMDPADFDRIKGVAIEMAATVPGWKMIYQKFYAPTFGDIFTVVR